jgi:hypothetical protein
MGIIGDVLDEVADAFNGVGEAAFANAGGVGYVAAASAISHLNRNRDERLLDARRKELLRPKFGDLIDDVAIKYGAEMVTVEVMGKRIGANPAGQTFGLNIYIKGPYVADSDAQLELLAHEMVHVKQYKSADGSLFEFGKRYFREYYRAGFKYEKNDMEQDADRFAACFMTRIASTVLYNGLWRSDWSEGWTSLVPMALGTDVFVLLYKKSGGAAKIVKIKPDGQGVTGVWEGDWSDGWTSFMPFVLNGKPHFLSYKTGNGSLHISRLNSGGAGVTKVGDMSWGTGWDIIMPFQLNGAPHYLAYKWDTGKVAIGGIESDGSDTPGIWSSEWAENWTTFHPFRYGNQPHVLTYKRGGGSAAIHRINADGRGVTNLWRGDWSDGWSIFLPLSDDGRKFFVSKGAIETPLGYIPGLGTTHVSDVGNPANGTKTLWCDIWRGSWRTGCSFKLNGAYHTLLYGAEQDEVHIGRFVV